VGKKNMDWRWTISGAIFNNTTLDSPNTGEIKECLAFLKINGRWRILRNLSGITEKYDALQKGIIFTRNTVWTTTTNADEWNIHLLPWF
jgi:hypothetical protein